jgi:hypothetical protein
MASESKKDYIFGTEGASEDKTDENKYSISSLTGKIEIRKYDDKFTDGLITLEKNNNYNFNGLLSCLGTILLIEDIYDYKGKEILCFKEGYAIHFISTIGDSTINAHFNNYRLTEEGDKIIDKLIQYINRYINNRAYKITLKIIVNHDGHNLSIPTAKAIKILENIFNHEYIYIEKNIDSNYRYNFNTYLDGDCIKMEKLVKKIKQFEENEEWDKIDDLYHKDELPKFYKKYLKYKIKYLLLRNKNN